MSVLNQLYTFSDLPEELLFNVSQFGQVAPGLTPEYILREVNLLQRDRLLTQGRLFDWAKEWTLEYLRATDPLFRQIGSILKVIPPGSLNNVRIPGDAIVFNLRGASRRQIDRILEASEAINVPTRITEKYDVVIRGVPDPGTLYHQITIPVAFNRLHSMQESVLNASYLAHPRTTLDRTNHRGHEYYSMITRGNPRMDERHDYPWLLSSINRANLPQAFPQWFPRQAGLRPTSVYVPSDLEIVRAILRLNPRYDLGDLLNWLRARDEVCSRVESTDIYELITQGVLYAIRADNMSGIVSLILRSPTEEQSQIVEQYVNSIGYQRDIRIIDLGPEVPITAPYNDIEKVNQLNSLIDDFLGSRMCLIDYLPRYEWDRSF